MKVALIAPPYPLEEFPSPPLGICYVAGACEAAGAQVRIFDYIVSRYDPEKLKKQLDEFAPDVVGATSVTLNFPAAAEIIKTVKRLRPTVVTMMGGPHVSFAARSSLQEYPEIDVIFIGEAEQSLQQWLPAYRDRASWGFIKGLAFLDEGQFFTTGEGDFIEDLNSLPLPSRQLLPISKYHALGFPISIITSRGCPNKCIFCLGRKMVGFKSRFRHPKLVADEIETILSLGFNRINIADDLFTANKKRVQAFCEEILNRGIRFDWSAFARVDTVHEETLRLMRQAGCDAVSFGIETGNPEMLKTIRKGITLDQARQAVSLCRKVGIQAHASFMIGLPGESHQTMSDTLEFAKELKIEHGYHMLAPFPGTTVREHVKDYDIEILTDDWKRYDANSAIVRTSQLSPEEMDEFVAAAYRPIFEEWEAMKRRYAEGLSKDVEWLRVEGDKRLHLMFKILSEDLIETEGIVATSRNHDAFEELNCRIARKTGFEEPFVRRYVADCIHKKYLSCVENNGSAIWQWAPVAYDKL
jgi:anaerobic magnesium-protoporphyrin IX monomethyl ester cyclase